MQSILALLTTLAAWTASSAWAQPAAATPPRGWNSYDSFNWVIDEPTFLAQAALQAQYLLPFGYEYAVIDYLWFQDLKNTSLLYTDENGRLQPDPNRFPSSAGGLGFRPIADKVKALGLKFGIHIMRGVSSAAIAAQAPVLDGNGATAATIAAGAATECPWYSKVQSVNTAAPGSQAFFNSLFAQYAEWGVEFIKNDCVFAQNFVPNEIDAASAGITNAGNGMVYSLSPGHAGSGEPAQAQEISGVVNMYRVADDDWDNWGDLLSHFPPAAQFAAAGLIGAPGKNGFSWPDLDMLPLGYIAVPCGSQSVSPNCYPNHQSSLTADEAMTQLSLWSMAKSPLFFGGDLRKMDNTTLAIVTNKEVLDVNANSGNNSCRVNCDPVNTPTGLVVWTASAGPKSAFPGTQYVAMFNTDNNPTTGQVNLPSLGLPGTYHGRNVWTGASVGTVSGTFSAPVNAHGVVLLALS